MRALETVLLDLRLAVRMMVRSPWFALVAVVSLSLGIGFAVSIAAVANGLPTTPQMDARQVPTFRSGVQLVAVYATVSDTSGRLLPDCPRTRSRCSTTGSGNR